jgi:hypothetical protein
MQKLTSQQREALLLSSRQSDLVIHSTSQKPLFSFDWGASSCGHDRGVILVFVRCLFAQCRAFQCHDPFALGSFSRICFVTMAFQGSP